MLFLNLEIKLHFGVQTRFSKTKPFFKIAVQNLAPKQKGPGSYEKTNSSILVYSCDLLQRFLRNYTILTKHSVTTKIIIPNSQTFADTTFRCSCSMCGTFFFSNFFANSY